MYAVALHPQSVDLLAKHIDYCRPEKWLHSPPMVKPHLFTVTCFNTADNFISFEGNVTTAANAQELGRYFQRRAAECGIPATRIQIVQLW